MCVCVYTYIYIYIHLDITVLGKEEVNLIWLIWIINLILTKEAKQKEKTSQAMIVYSVVILFYSAFPYQAKIQTHYSSIFDYLWIHKKKLQKEMGWFLLLLLFLILLYKRAEQMSSAVWLQ